MRQISQSIEYLQYIDKLISQKKHLHQCEKQYKCYQGNKLETKKMYHAESQEIKWEKEKKKKTTSELFRIFLSEFKHDWVSYPTDSISSIA